VREHRDLEHRTFKFACDVADLCGHLTTRGLVVRQLSRKLLDAGTSVGANYEEAIAAQSRPDFISKCSISLKEARETRFWLRVIATCDGVTVPRVSPLVIEAGELVAILGAVARNARAGLRRS
jgi:four helix bundle protein